MANQKPDPDLELVEPQKFKSKREAFAHHHIENGGNATEAYIQAYGFKGRRRNATIRARRAMMHPDIAERIKQIQAELRDAHMWSRFNSITHLSEIATDERLRVQDRLTAIKELNNMHGFNELNINNPDGNLTPTVITRRIVKREDVKKTS